jgi:hypothetical protein
VYFKRAVSTPNFLNFGNDKWICSAGTVVRDGQIGTKALENCYSDFISNGIPGVQENAIGHFAIAVSDPAAISIFVDPLGSLNLYYFHDREFWFISNSLSLCARILPHRKIDSTKLLINAVKSTLPGEDTFYCGIKRLFGSQALRIEMPSGILQVTEVPKIKARIDWKFSRIEDAVEAYKAEVQSVFRELTAIGSIGIFGTGGLDSRTVLAAVLNQKTAPSLMYAIGNSKQTDYDPADLDVVSQIAKRYDLPFRQLDWSGSQPFKADTLNSLFDLYGFDYEIYGASEGFLKTLNGDLTPYPDLLLGGYSPAFTNAKPWQLPERLYSFDELVKDKMRSTRGSIEDSECIASNHSYREIVAAEMRIALQREGLDFPATGVDLDTYVRAKLFLYIRAESRFLNLVNAFGNYIAPFLIKRLYEPLLSVPFSYRANDEFQIRMIQTLAPGLTAIPLYSGWGPARINPETYHLERDYPSEPFSARLKRVIWRLVPTPVLVAAKKLRSRPRSHAQSAPPTLAPQDAVVIQNYGSEIMSDPLGRRWFNQLSEFTPKEITRIRHYIAAVNHVGYSE